MQKIDNSMKAYLHSYEAYRVPKALRLRMLQEKMWYFPKKKMFWYSRKNPVNS